MSPANASVVAPRVMIVDDHPIVREGTALFLNTQGEFHLCCEAGSAEEALRVLEECKPQMVIVDLGLNKDSGLELIRALARKNPALRLLAMSLYDETVFAERALRAGAHGYLMKQEATARILTALRKVHSGGVYLSEAMHNRLAQTLLSVPAGQATVDPVSRLSEREFEVLHLIGLGYGTRQISEKLNRSVKTIEAHRASLKDKLSLKTGNDLVRFAIQWIDRPQRSDGPSGAAPRDGAAS